MKARCGAIAVLVVVAVGVLAVGGWNVAWSTMDVEIVGTYDTFLPDRAETARLWAEMHPESPTVVPIEEMALVEATWTDRQHTHWPASECEFVVLLTHGPDVDTVGLAGNAFSFGSSSVIDEALNRYPAIPREVNELGVAEFGGSAFFVDAQRQRPTLMVLLNWRSSAPSLDEVRTGVLFSCDGRVIGFEWLTSI